MAKLTSENVTLEIGYSDYFAGWVMYEINFLWRGVNIINEDVLLRHGHRAKCKTGAMWGNDDRECGLLPVLENVITTNLPDSWEPLEPNITLGIYPEEYFPFLESKTKRVWVSDEFRRTEEERARLKAEKGMLPNDHITLIFFVDQYAFKDCDAYGGNGISLHLIVQRQELEGFYEVLKAEYLEYKKQFKVDEYNREVGDNWKPMEL